MYEDVQKLSNDTKFNGKGQIDLFNDAIRRIISYIEKDKRVKKITGNELGINASLDILSNLKEAIDNYWFVVL